MVAGINNPCVIITSEISAKPVEAAPTAPKINIKELPIQAFVVAGKR